MKRLMLLTVVALLFFTGCKNVEKLGPGNELAMENQTNLEKNVVRILGNLDKLYKEYGDAEDKASLVKQKAVIIEQLTINYGWLLTIKNAVEANDIDPGFFLKVVTKAPGWIEQGKDIYDLIKELSKKED
jgi:hypothetical protein